MDSTEVLPFRGSHLRASLGGTRWRVCKESDYEGVDADYEESAELVKPKRAFGRRRRHCEDGSCLPVDGHSGIWLRVDLVVVQSFEMLL